MKDMVVDPVEPTNDNTTSDNKSEDTYTAQGMCETTHPSEDRQRNKRS